MYYVTEVGKLFIPGKTRYKEGVYFEHTGTGPCLVFALHKPTAQEVEAAKKGRVELALYGDPPVLFLLHRIRGLEQWSDSPFSIRLYKDKEFNLPRRFEEGEGWGLQIVLVDAGTGILLALRVVGTSTRFANELRAAIMRQYEAPFTIEAYHAKIDEVYRKYTSQDLLALAVAKHTAGRGGFE